jgi:ATP-dependent RNA helicase SUPV3L1/SUV3
VSDAGAPETLEAAPADAAEPVVATEGIPETNTQEEAQQEVQEFIEVWRPGRSEERRGPRRPRHARKRSGEHAARAGAEPVQGQDSSKDGRDGERKERGGRPRRHRPDRDRPDRERPDRERPSRDEGRRPAFAKGGKRPERREKAPDPNSPFAKLAALKAQLEANAKERT